MDISRETSISLLTTMMTIRTFELQVERLYLEGRIPGDVHPYIGEEAVAAGVCGVLEPKDYITSTHRGHGHAIAKGARLDRMMAELFGKRTGYCRGKGGSMHIADFSVGMLGANGIVGGGLTIAMGAALSAKMQESGQVAVCFFGDGASNRGTFHEALNMAAIFCLPVVFVCENNSYASTTHVHYSTSVENISERAAAYDMPGMTVDGNDVVAVYSTACDAVGRARAGHGPSLVEAKTYRWRGHYIGDPELYRDNEDVDERTDRCPILRHRKLLSGRGIADEAELTRIQAAIDAEVDRAVRFAQDSQTPAPAEALEDLYSVALHNKVG